MDAHPAVTAAVELQPLIREHLVEGEKRARLTQEVVTAVGKAGLFRLYAPREVGGLEVLPSVFLAATEAVSVADPAVGWYMGNSLAARYAAAWQAESERAQLFAEPDRHFGVSAVPVGQAIPADGGYRVSGQWPVVTGCEDAKWCAMAGFVMDGTSPRQVSGLPDQRMFLIPTAELTISPTWQQAAAMRGTGSNAMSAENVFVPEGMAHTPTKPLVIDRPLFRLPVPLLFVPVIAAVAIGVLGSAVERAQEELSTEVSAFSGQAQRDQAPVQELIASSRVALRAVRAGLHELTDELGKSLTQGAEVPIQLKADLYASAFYTVNVARMTVSELYAHGTRAGFLHGNPVERALRNLHAIAFGIDSVRPLLQSAGRVVLGGDPTHPAF